MSQPDRVAAPPRAKPELLDRLREDLQSYTLANVEAALGDVAAAALLREQPVPALRALSGRQEPCATLFRLFVLGQVPTRREVATALPRLGVDGAASCGLVVSAGHGPDDGVRAVVDLVPYSAQDSAGDVDWWLASDVSELASGRPLAAEHVLGVGGASRTLAQLTVRDPVSRVLDLGTGCGIQALHAARHAQEVVATDISGRALAFARLNAALAGVRVELRRGSLLEPVAGEEFDLVVSNPPFVITPRGAGSALASHTYRDGGRAGDDLLRDLVLGLGGVLAPGGVAQLLGNWEHHLGGGWQERVRGWLDAGGLDGWLIQREVADPAEYAETWLRDGGLTPEREPAAWRAGYEAWLGDFAARGVTGVGFGYLTLRRPRSGRPTLRRVEELPGPVAGPLGEHLAACLRAHDWLATTDDRALASARLVVAADVTEERHYRPGDADPQVVLIRQGSGFGRVIRVGTALAGLVGACDGELNVGQIVAALAALLQAPADGLAGEVLPGVRDLVRDGLLVPEPD